MEDKEDKGTANENLGTTKPTGNSAASHGRRGKWGLARLLKTDGCNFDLPWQDRERNLKRGEKA